MKHVKLLWEHRGALRACNRSHHSESKNLDNEFVPVCWWCHAHFVIFCFVFGSKITCISNVLNWKLIVLTSITLKDFGYRKNWTVTHFVILVFYFYFFEEWSKEKEASNKSNIGQWRQVRNIVARQHTRQ